MPTLDWIGKAAVVNHHQEVPTKLLHCDGALSAGNPDGGNLLVEGDNLEALKALLPYYAGQVKCIYIDPPYNTGNEGWVYNDNVNSPEIRAWLAKVVGREGEDFSRHDKWLCMIYPRLRLLREFLRRDGSIWVSIDDNEGHYLKAILDEVFGRRNFVGTFVWERDAGGRGDASVSVSHDFILAYARDRHIWDKTRNLLERTVVQAGRFRNPDNDPRGPWRQGDDGTAKSGTDKQRFPITLPSGRTVTPKQGRYWAFSQETFAKARAEGRAYFGKKGNSLPVIKRYATIVREGVAPRTWLTASDVGTNQSAKRDHLSKLLPDIDSFDTPKPESLLERIIHIATNSGELVLDSFLGSGTTAAAAHKMGRRWIGIEMGAHARTHCALRLRKVLDGEMGGISESVDWKGGGGFRYCTLGKPLFDEWGCITKGVTFGDLAAFVFFSDTGNPIPARATGETSLLGAFDGRAVHLLWSPESAGVANEAAGNVLTPEVLAELPKLALDFAGPATVYAEGCTVSAERLTAVGVSFRQIPYQVMGQ